MTSQSRIQSHRDLKVWQLGMELAARTYPITRTFPDDERFGLVSQLRRAAISVPANIAEGNVRSSTKDYLRHLSIAIGSLAEFETFLELANWLNFTKSSLIADLMEAVSEKRRMLRGLQRSRRAKLNAHSSDL